MPKAAPKTRKWSAVLNSHDDAGAMLRVAGEVATHGSGERVSLVPRARQFSASMLALDLSVAGEASEGESVDWKLAEYCHSPADDVASVEIYCGSQRLQSLDIRRAH